MSPKPPHSRFQPGDPVPWFGARASNTPHFTFDSIAGRHVVLCFFGSTGPDDYRRLLGAILARRDLFDDEIIAFFGVSVDPKDESEKRVRQRIPGIRFVWDFDGKISRAYGALGKGAGPGEGSDVYQPFILVLDPMLRVQRSIAFDVAAPARLFEVLERLPRPGEPGTPIHAPVLILPNVFEREFCRHLIDLYERHGGIETGFMREIDGKTVGMLDHRLKRRRDYEIAAAGIRLEVRRQIKRRLVPEVEKAFRFKATHLERYIVACYDAATGGYFRPHRDNTTKGTAHRQFAVTLNLNAEDYEGGDLRFPEFGPRTYRAPTGGAVVFACSLLHEATPMISGRRYAFLPFLYDVPSARIRDANRNLIVDETGTSEAFRAGGAADRIPAGAPGDRVDRITASSEAIPDDGVTFVDPQQS